MFPGCCSVIEQTRRDNPFVIDDFSVRKRFRQTECAAIVLTAVLVQINAVILIVGHTGTGICITESKHITPRAPCALAISAGAVVAFLIDAGGAGSPVAFIVLPACNVIIVECGRQIPRRCRAVIDHTDDGVAMDINDFLIGIRYTRAVREVNVRSVLIPVVRIGAVCASALLQNPDLSEVVAGVFGQLVDVGRIRSLDVFEFIVRIHAR